MGDLEKKKKQQKKGKKRTTFFKKKKNNKKLGKRRSINPGGKGFPRKRFILCRYFLRETVHTY